ncbi:FAD-dependent oxidoreductase [Exilibacterium tricleocarpae]|uniref:FAD-dependent oxidoreductase n=1 Tax=Exilibacterium tricleocarpae TaxID=2591008 RepID=A0A545TS78_9GAMM|nr:FAD-dependent oxidoreductase [Exilibacterium tricleocarpae]TQV80073.1 FAD-dependent oxidoreductase [Exilibacterium tricleocarpae]
MRIAIIGSGISGLTAAYLLNREHDITVFESRDRIGGHTATIDVSVNGSEQAIDTGFIVYNDWTYPNFIDLLAQLGVASQPTNMGFSVSCRQTGLEYSGAGFSTLFAQRRNLLRPRHWRMLADIVRFNREAVADLEQGRIDAAATLGDYLTRRRYSQAFIRHYLVPMGAAIWSASTDTMLNFPLAFFVRFFKNHGLLSITDRPQWRVIKGGSREYLGPLTAGFKKRIKVATPIQSVRRQGDRVLLSYRGDDGPRTESYDHVVMACHSDQALQLLGDASAAEQRLLGAIPYQDNEVILHTDTTLLPRRRSTWSSWNYLLTDYRQERPVLTYNMNILQGLDHPTTFCVTLNQTAAIDPAKILGHFNYAHPVFNLDGIAAQQRWGDINGVNRTWFCGAYWGNGFHEDGVSSALRVAEALGDTPLAAPDAPAASTDSPAEASYA